MEKLQPILAKLKGVVDHLEKVFLGVVLVAVAVISGMKMMGVRSELDTVNKATQNNTLGGQMRQPDDMSFFSNLVRVSREDPPRINLEGANHTVFNSAKWNKIVTNGVTILVRDTATLPLGISALKVEDIREIKLVITPKIQYNRSPTQLGKNNMRYTFEADDEFPARHMTVPEYMVYVRKIRNAYYAQRTVDTIRIRSFLPQIRPFGGKKAQSPSLQPLKRPDLKPLHLFGRNPPPSWYVGFLFTEASPARRIEDVIVTLDIIYGLPGGGFITNKNMKAKADGTIAFTRGYMADLVFQTKYTSKPIRWENAREGLRLSIDQEIFKILKITADQVQLVSDLEYGGNGQIYDKPLKRGGPGPVRPNLPNIPVPGGTTNTAPASPPVANPSGINSPGVGGQ